MEQVLRHIKKVYKENGENITYDVGNGRNCLLLDIPSNKNFHSFRVHADNTKWVESLLEHVGDNDNDSGAYYIGSCLARNYRISFLSAAKEIGVSICKKMSAHAAAAMWTSAGVTEKASKTIVRHLKYAFG